MFDELDSLTQIVSDCFKLRTYSFEFRRQYIMVCNKMFISATIIMHMLKDMLFQTLCWMPYVGRVSFVLIAREWAFLVCTFL